MVEMQLEYNGNLKMTATHGPSGATIRTDAPKDNQGEGKFFSPTDLVCAALASCMVTTMAIVAKRDGLVLDGTKIKASKEMVSAPTRRIGRLTVNVNLPKAIAEEHRAKLEHAAEICPVKKSLHDDVEVITSYVWDI